MLYFAYGSNMHWGQMKSRCPSAEFLCLAVLRDHKLAFTRKSDRRKGGVADVPVQSRSKVWGVVYQIDEVDVAKLDAAEGFKPGRRREENHYFREERHVFQEDIDKLPLLVAIYFACPHGDHFPPHRDYKNLIIEGARYWHLPEEYIKNVLEPIECKI